MGGGTAPSDSENVAVDSAGVEEDAVASAIEGEKSSTDNTIPDVDDTQEMSLSSDGTMPNGLVDIDAEIGNDNSSQQNTGLWFIDKQLHGDASKLTEGEYVYIKFYSPDSNGLPTMVSMNYHLRSYAYGQTEPVYRDVNGEFTIKNVEYTEEAYIIYCELTQGENNEFEGALYTDENEFVYAAIRQVGDY